MTYRAAAAQAEAAAQQARRARKLVAHAPLRAAVHAKLVNGKSVPSQIVPPS